MPVCHSLTDLCKALDVEYNGRPSVEVGGGFEVSLSLGVFFIFRNGKPVETASAKDVVEKIKKLRGEK